MKEFTFGVFFCTLLGVGEEKELEFGVVVRLSLRFFTWIVADDELGVTGVDMDKERFNLGVLGVYFLALLLTPIMPFKMEEFGVLKEFKFASFCNTAAESDRPWLDKYS